MWLHSAGRHRESPLKRAKRTAKVFADLMALVPGKGKASAVVREYRGIRAYQTKYLSQQNSRTHAMRPVVEVGS
jgi:hypothetical protein